MFTGIIECLGTIRSIKKDGGNIILRTHSPISDELKIDQSVAHNGVCLTVTAIEGSEHEVCIIQESIEKSNMQYLKEGDPINLERCIKADGRLDGHFVQGHVDMKTPCTKAIVHDGSWEYHFALAEEMKALVVSKGSVCINGVSLTISHLDDNSFGVSIIPYTYENTNFKNLKESDYVNIEFDILGKYMQRYLSLQ